jgi:hypothetical protein
VPPQVERLQSLRILDLTNNRIANGGLPMTLTRLPHLKAIGLKKNCLTAVPRVLGYMCSLQEIYLEDNTDLEVCAHLTLHHVMCLLLCMHAFVPSRDLLPAGGERVAGKRIIMLMLSLYNTDGLVNALLESGKLALVPHDHRGSSAS